MVTPIKSIGCNGYSVSIFRGYSNYYIYVYSKGYFILIKTMYAADKNNSNVTRNQIFTHGGCLSALNIFIKQFIVYKNNKIKFTGKGYKIKKNNKNNLLLLFNRAHITNITYFNVFLKKIKKYKICIYGNSKNIAKLTNVILNIRHINIFTKKGLRLARQLVLKKKSKK